MKRGRRQPRFGGNLSGLPPPHRGPTRYFLRLRHFAAAVARRPPSEGVDSLPHSGLTAVLHRVDRTPQAA